jgi:hypothetical protein
MYRLPFDLIAHLRALTATRRLSPDPMSVSVGWRRGSALDDPTGVGRSEIPDQVAVGPRPRASEDGDQNAARGEGRCRDLVATPPQPDGRLAIRHPSGHESESPNPFKLVEAGD